MAAPTLASAIHRALALAARQGVGVTDAQLLERYVRRRDEAAFELLVWRHGAMILGVCRRILGHTQDAEDAFQATFLALARQAASLGGREGLGGWLYRVASRIAHRARAQAAQRLAREQTWQPAVSGDRDEVESRDLRTVLDEEIERLPDRLRAAVILCHLEGRTSEEAARELGCPAGTVKSRLSEARSRLALALTRRGVTLSAAALLAALAPPASAAPPALVASAMLAATRYMTGGVAAAGLVAPRAVALVTGVFRAMFIKKLIPWVALALLCGVTAFGLAAYRGGAPPEPKADEAWRRRETRIKKDKDVCAVALSPDGKTLAVGTKEGAVRFFDVASGKQWPGKKELLEKVESLAFTADGKKLAAGSAGEKTVVFDAASGKLDKLLDLRGNAGLAFSADGKLLLAGIAQKEGDGPGGNVNVVDVASNESVVSYAAGGNVQAVAFAHAGRRAVAVGGVPDALLADRGLTQVSVYDINGAKPYDGWLSGHDGNVWCAAFSRDDRLLATGGADRDVIVWDVKTGRGEKLTGHTAAVRAISFSGKSLASVGDDNTVRIWDVAGRKPLAALEGHKDGLRAVHLSADGKTVIAVSALGEVAVWERGRRP